MLAHARGHIREEIDAVETHVLRTHEASTVAPSVQRRHDGGCAGLHDRGSGRARRTLAALRASGAKEVEAP